MTADQLNAFSGQLQSIADSYRGDGSFVTVSHLADIYRVAAKLAAAQAIEAQRAETAKTGSVEDESAVAESDVPKGSPVGSQIG